MRKSFEALDRDHQLLLLAMLDVSSARLDAERLTSAYERIGGSASASKLLDDLTGHFVRKTEL